MMLAPACPMRVEISPRTPGLSGVSRTSRIKRPSRIMPRWRTLASARLSMFAPQIGTPTRRPWNNSE
jgi:hypothetical protein